MYYRINEMKYLITILMYIQVNKSFTKLWNSGQTPPKPLWTDKGGEFVNIVFTNLLEEKKFICIGQRMRKNQVL